uniref:Uncharacterized protein n=1 Tax=Candidatus Kentrum sp. LFY TaxID=2126342 RepID=A0A450UHY1_9GAMM|nr:MAG: hypothetical protein BECKLFY1418A_GA0070994_10216 [Candidatus Kentron sp. LFY]
MEMIKHMDWQMIRNASIFLGISALIGASVMIIAATFLTKAKDQHHAQERRLDDARIRYQRLGEEKAMIDAYSPRFQDLVRDGLIGKERRLTWLDTLRSAARRIGLPELRYTISSRKPHAPNFPVHDGPYRIQVTDMQLTMGLLHEGDLFSLLTELDRHAVGTYHVVYCGLRRARRSLAFPNVLAPGIDRANLHAQCTLRWYTLERTEP